MPQSIPTFSRRCLQPELMDAPGLAQGEHVAALRALARVNATGSKGTGTPPLWEDRTVTFQIEAHDDGHRTRATFTAPGGRVDMRISFQ